MPFIEKQLAALPKEIDKLKDDIMKAAGPEQKARLEANLQQAEAYLAELKTLKPTLPTRTITSTISLNEQGREIQLLLLGPRPYGWRCLRLFAQGKGGGDWGCGDGLDALPERRLPGGVGADLDALDKVDFTQMILGHGEVATKAHLAFFQGYLTDLIASVKKAAADGASLDEMKKTIPDQLASQYESGMSKYPWGSIGIGSGSISKWSTRRW